MKNLSFTILCLILFIGVFQAKSQNKSVSKEEYKVFKQKLMTGEQVNYQYQDQNSELLNQKGSFASKNFGDTPDLNWAGHFGGTGNDNAEAVVSDDAGNIYITGSFSGQMSFSGNDYTATGIREAYVAKFDNTGSLVWLIQIPATADNATYCNDICMDATGNLYVTGYYTGAITVGTSNLPDVNEYTLFYTKLNNEGDLLNGAYHSEDENEIGLFIDTDDSGNIYITGTTNTNFNSKHASWILKYDNSGNLLWEMEHDEGFNDIIIYNSNIYYTGVIRDFDDGYIDENLTLTIPSIYNDVFIAKSDLDGVFEWGIVASHSSLGGDSYDSYFETDNNGNFYMTGCYRISLTFGPDTINGMGSFITKFDESGSFSWLNHYGDSDDTPELTVDDTGNSYVVEDDSMTKYDTDGIEQWTEVLDYNPTCHTINSSDKLIIAGNTDRLIFVSQLDNTANEEWTNQFEGNSGPGNVFGMVTDNSGNVYTLGDVSNTTEYFGEEVNRGTFICKQDDLGNAIWLNLFPDNLLDFCLIGQPLHIDTITNHLYIAGGFTEDLVIPGETTLTPAENGSIFLLKYDLDGNYVWSVQEDFSGEEVFVVSDNSGNVVLSGLFEGTITIGTTNLTSAGNKDGFIAKYDTDGNFLWAIRAGGEDIEFIAIISTDASDNIYLTGEFTSENVTVNGTVITLAEGDGNILFAKLDSNGNVLWFTSHAGSTINYGDYYCWPTGIITDAADYTYIKGWHGDSVYFNDILLTSPYGSGYSYFIAKFDPSGNTVWANSITEHTYGFDYNQFDIDYKGNVYLGAQARDTLNFGEDFEYVNSGKDDLFIAKYTTNGDLDWVKAMPGDETSLNWLQSVAVYDTTHIFAAGHFGNYLHIGNEEFSSINRHGFLAMFDFDIVGIKEVYKRNNKEFVIYPNPSTGLVTINCKSEFFDKIEIINVTGQMVHSVNITSKNIQIDLSNSAKGLYFVKIKGDNYYKTEKLIIE